MLSEDAVVAADGSFTVTAHTEIRADNEAGAMQASRLSVLYDSEMQQVEIVEAHTLKPDGTKIPIELNTIYEQLPPDNSLAVTSFRVKVLLFPQFSAGDTAVYTVRFKTPKAMFPGAFQYGKAFPRAIAFPNASITITAPKSLALRIENHDVTFEKEDRGDTIVYRWRHTALASDTANSALVSPLDREPRFFVSSFKDYGDLGRSYAAQSEPKSAVTAKIKALADDITAGTTSRRDQARLIYEWVAKHIRPIAVELGRGSFVPHDAETVIGKGYGDCKDHDVLLQALLRAKGIEAESVLINSGNAYTLAQAPSFAQLDHVITYIPEFGIYLDSTASVASFGVLPLQEYGKPAVTASMKTAGLITMPMPGPGAATVHQATVQKIEADGTLHGTTTTSATGPLAANLRVIGYAIQAVGAEKAAELQMAARGLKDGTGKLIADPLAELGDSYTIRGEFSAKGWDSALKDGTVMPGGLRVFSMTGDEFMGPLYVDDKTADEATQCVSVSTDEDVSLELPAGYQFRSIPDDVRISTPKLTFTAHWTMAGRTMAVHRTFSSTIDQPVCSGAVRKQTADALKRIAHSYDENLQIIRSLDDYNKSLNEKPKDADTLIGRGIAYEKAGEHQKAIADFDAALANKPNDSWALFNRAYSYENLDQHDRALEDYTKVIALDDKNATALGNRGFIYSNQGKYLLAIADFDKALALERDNADYLNARGRVYRLTRQYDRAIADLTRAIDARSDFALAHYNLGATYYSQQRFEKALAEYDKAIALDPTDYFSYWDRSSLYRISRRSDLALKDLNKALELAPGIANLWAERANLHSLLNQPDAASADLAKALAIDPHSAAAIRVRADMRVRNGQGALAIEDFSALIAQNPDDAMSYSYRATAYQTLRDLDRALADINKAIALAPNEAFFYFERGQIKHAMGDHVGGNQDIGKALKLDPHLAH